VLFCGPFYLVLTFNVSFGPCNEESDEEGL
jgi:hypothetical protein